MEDTFLTFSSSLPVATLLMVMVLFVTGSKSSAVRRHQWLGWGLALACLIPLIDPHLPQWRILPRIEGLTDRPMVVESRFPWFLTFAAIWFLGAAWMITRTIAGLGLLCWHQRFTIPVDEERMLEIIEQCQERSGLREAPEVFLQPNYSMPMTWGWLRPKIWLPLEAEDWSNDELECVLLHEMAHIERQDFPSEILNRICLAIYWFHPVAWLLARRLELAREMACDDQVLLAGKPAANYAESLAQVGAGLAATLPETAAGFLGRKPLIARMIGIADPWRTRRRLTNEDILATVAPLTMAALFMCSLGFKAAAEIHADRAERIQPKPEFPVVSVWDDVVLPAARTLDLVPKTTEPITLPQTPTRKPPLPPSFAPPARQQNATAPPSPSDELPLLLAGLDLPITAPTVPFPSNQILQPRMESPLMLGYARRSSQPISEPDPAAVSDATAPSETDQPTNKQSVSIPDAKESTDTSSATKEQPDVAATDSSDSAKNNEPEPRTKKENKAPAPPKTVERQRRELAAAIASDGGARRLKVDCLVAKGTATKQLRAEITTDFKTWTSLSGAGPLAIQSAGAENDRLTLMVAANVGSGFVRIREITPQSPIPNKSVPKKGMPSAVVKKTAPATAVSLPPPHRKRP